MSGKPSFGIRLFSAALVVGGCLLPGIVQADSVRLRVDLDTIQSNTQVENKLTGETFETDFSRINQQYDFAFKKTLYPNLAALGGALYEQTDNKTSSAGLEFESSQIFLRPFARLSLDTPMYRAGVEYRRSDITNDATGSDTTKRTQDNLNTILGWRPEGLPNLTLRYDQTHSKNDEGTQDLFERNWNLETDYSPTAGLQLFYFYRREEGENRVFNSKTTNQRHNGRVDYSRGFFENRLGMSTGYQIIYQQLESEATGIVETEIVPAAGLSSIDDTPQDGPALALNNALIDGIRGVSAGIDIGLGGDETTLTNIGIDLGLPADINRIRLWVDQRLTPAVAASFSWDVYTSPDNLDTSTWTLAASISPAPFGAFENRFEIAFPTVNTRFIKIVVRPLSPALPGSGSFPNIFVTEIEPFSDLSGVGRQLVTQESIDQNANFSLTGRISEKTVIGYDLYYRARERDRVGTAATDDSSEMTNGIFFRHLFNETFSGNARIQRTETEINEDRIVDHSLSASLRADYLKTFNQIFTYTGAQTEVDDGTSTTHSLFLRNNLQLYQGWSAFADVGLTYDETLLAERIDTQTVRLGTNVIPHRTLTLNFDYQVRSFGSSDSENQRRTDIDYNAQAFYVPFPALSFFGKYTLRDRQDQRTSLQNYAVNWSPFRDGTLQVSLNFNETLEPENDRTNRSFGPFVKWNISRHMSLETQYSVNISDTPTQAVNTQTAQASLTFIW